MEKVLINIEIDPNLKEKLKAKAKSKGLTLSGYIRMVLLENLEKQ